jgi:TorA maturation chaperone TorD
MHQTQHHLYKGEEAALAPEERGRLQLYRLISGLMLGPHAATFQQLTDDAFRASLLGDAPLTVVMRRLSDTAHEFGFTRVQAEYDRLFIAVGTPAVNPYESRYRSGFLMEKPLVTLRQDLSALGLARASESRELEDHLAALCETMGWLIVRRAPLDQQQEFFETHLAPWYESCLADIAALPEIHFYTALSDLIALFFDIEAQAFEIGAANSSTDADADAPLASI